MRDALPLLETISAWIALLGVPSNSLTPGAHNMSTDGGTNHIFVNGNLARTLLSTYRLQERVGAGKGNPEYLRQGLAWCDTFAELQARVHTTRGADAGYWGAGCKPRHSPSTSPARLRLSAC